jgi:hypothetical protein
MPTSTDDPMYFVWWIVLTMIAQFPLRLHNESSLVVGAGQQIFCDLVELTAFGVRFSEMFPGHLRPDRRYLVYIANKDLVSQISEFITYCIYNSFAVLKKFIMVTMKQRYDLHRDTITPRHLKAKVGVCDTIISVCTQLLSKLLCRFDVYCCNRITCGCCHWSLGSVARMQLSTEDSRFVDRVYQKYGARIYAVIYNRGGLYYPHLFYKAYRYMYKESFVKMSKHLFLRVLLRISTLEVRQVPCGIVVSIRSDVVYKHACRDRGVYEYIRRERRRITAAAVREESRELFLELELQAQMPLEVASDGEVIPGQS